MIWGLIVSFLFMKSSLCDSGFSTTTKYKKIKHARTKKLKPGLNEVYYTVRRKGKVKIKSLTFIHFATKAEFILNLSTYCLQGRLDEAVHVQIKK